MFTEHPVNVGTKPLLTSFALLMARIDSPWVSGMLLNNGFSLSGTVPVIAANWMRGGAKWTLPVGAQTGRLIKLGGKLPVNLLVGAYYHALRPVWFHVATSHQVAIVF